MHPESRLNAVPDIPIHTIQAASKSYAGDGPLLDFSQGVLGALPAEAVRRRVAEAALAGKGSAYVRHGDLVRLTHLFLADLASTHGPGVSQHVDPTCVSITNGANEAFCGGLATITQSGDHVVMTSPYYFNQHIWVSSQGLETSYWSLPDDQPDFDALRSLITPRTKAVIVCTPGNPTGAQLSPADIRRLSDLTREAGVWLVLDETYRAFSRLDGPVHDLFEDPSWGANVMFTYSFSKEFGIPGYRIGVLVAQPEVHPQFDKWRECVSIMPSAVGVVAGEACVEEAQDWRDYQTKACEERGDALRSCLEGAGLGWTWTSGGALYGWVRHGRDHLTDLELARWLAAEYGVMTLPGSAFDQHETGHLRWSVGTATTEEIALLRDRLAQVRLS